MSGGRLNAGDRLLPEELEDLLDLCFIALQDA
jgi:hypothetical protein